MHSTPLPHPSRTRRRLLTAAAASLASPLGWWAAGTAQAQQPDFPTRPITVIVPQAAGGASDTLTRLWADYVGKRIGQPVLVDNKPGAGAIVAVQAVLQKPADGYTLFSGGTSSIILNKLTQKSLPYDAKDFRGVAMLGKFSYLLLASVNSQLRSFDDLVRRAREKPGALNFGSGGLGNGSHFMLEMLQKEAKIQLAHVPYKGELPYVTALLADEVQVVVASIGVGVPQVQAGKAVALALLGEQRLPELPNVPLAGEVGVKGFEGLFWSAILARTGTPDAATRKVHAATQEFLKDPEILRTLQKMQTDPAPGPMDAYETVLANDMRKWTDLASGLNLVMN